MRVWLLVSLLSLGTFERWEVRGVDDERGHLNEAGLDARKILPSGQPSALSWRPRSLSTTWGSQDSCLELMWTSCQNARYSPDRTWSASSPCTKDKCSSALELVSWIPRPPLLLVHRSKGAQCGPWLEQTVKSTLHISGLDQVFSAALRNLPFKEKPKSGRAVPIGTRMSTDLLLAITGNSYDRFMGGTYIEN